MRCLLILAVTVLLFLRSTLSTQAGTIALFELEWSGEKFGNTAEASAIITLDTTLINLPGVTRLGIDGPFVSDLALTILGASGGNGVFTLSDFGDVIFLATLPLDFGRELVGQPAAGGATWGQFPGSDFNLIPASPGAPHPFGPLQLRPEGSSDTMALTSFRPVRPIPEPAAGLLLVVALLPLALRRRRVTAP